MTKAETETQVASLKDIITEHKEVLKGLDKHRDYVDEELKDLKALIHALTVENRVLTQRIDDQQKHIDKWDNRIWAFIGALLTLAAGLIVTLSGLRKSP